MHAMALWQGDAVLLLSSRLAVPLLAIDQGATAFVVGMTLYAALPAVLALPAGRMTDRLGWIPWYSARADCARR